MYLILNIFTQFHKVSDSSSNEKYMLEGLNRVKIIFWITVILDICWIRKWNFFWITKNPINLKFMQHFALNTPVLTQKITANNS
jgi:hypothetical protein